MKRYPLVLDSGNIVELPSGDYLAPSIGPMTTTTTVLDFGPTISNIQTINVTLAATFTTANLTAGVSKEVFITGGAVAKALTFPASWIFYGARPTLTLIGKEIRLRLVSYGTTDATVRVDADTQS